VNIRTAIAQFCAAALLLVLATAGCTDDPNQLGRGLLLPKDTLRLGKTGTYATGDTSFSLKSIDNAGRLFVGVRDNLEAVSIVMFTGVPAFTTTQTIDSVKLFLVPDYANFDTTGPFGFTASYALRTWSSVNFTWDSLPGFAAAVPSGSFYAPSWAGHDSSISLNLDTSVIHVWMQTGVGSLILRTTQQVLGMNMIAGFRNFTSTEDYRPEIQVFYRDVADTTIVLHLRSPAGVSVMNESSPPSPTSVLVEAGPITRGLIRFDSLTIPAKASITEATLYLPVDTTGSRLNIYSHDSLYVSMERKNYYPYDSTAFGVVSSPAYIGGRKYYTGDVKNIVQYWVSHGQNYGMLIRPYAENTTVDRTVLFGSHSPVIRPSITITYSVLP